MCSSVDGYMLRSEPPDGFLEDQVDDVLKSVALGERPELTLGAVALVERPADDLRHLLPIPGRFESGAEERQHGLDQLPGGDGSTGMDVDQLAVEPEPGGAPPCGFEE